MPSRRTVVLTLAVMLLAASQLFAVDLCPWCSGPNQVNTSPGNPIFFGTTPTPIGVTVITPYQIMIGGATITGWMWDGNKWTNNGVILTGRNDVASQSDPDRGIGICSEGITACQEGTGNVNELSNQKNFELIQISFGNSQSTWSNIRISSLDKNGGGAPGSFSPETGQLFYGDADPGMTFDPNVFAKRICDYFTIDAFVPTGPAFCNEANKNSSETDLLFQQVTGKNLFIWAGTGTLSTDPNFGNDFLIGGVGAPTQVPEPASLALLASGLATIGFSIRHKRRG